MTAETQTESVDNQEETPDDLREYERRYVRLAGVNSHGELIGEEVDDRFL